jgi:DNA-binding transcriptional LysR family regulator
MQIQTLKIYCDLVDSGSFSRAAELNGITQSAVSQQVRGLEERYGVRLLERRRHQVVLTAEGRALLESSRKIMGELSAVERRLERLREQVRGCLRVATVLSIGLHELPACLKYFRREFPDVEVKVSYERSSGVYAAVRDGSADLGLVAYPAERRGIGCRTFWKDQLVLVCSPQHPLAGSPSVSLRDLNGLPFLSFAADQPTRKFLDRKFRQYGVRVRRIMELDNIETLKRTVENENALAILPETGVRAEVRAGSLCSLSVQEPGMWRPLGVLFRKNAATSPSMGEFLNMLASFDLGRLGLPASTTRP